MRPMIRLAGFLLAIATALTAFGHGTPIHVGVVDDGLTVSGGLADDEGFASMIFLEEDEDGDPFGSFTLPSLGPVIIWQLPGLEISGMVDQSSLSIEALRRPVKDSNPAEDRLLWYWNPASELLEAAPASAAMYLLGTGMRSATLAPPDGVAPPPFTLANSMAGQQGFHNHGLLSYALDNSPPPLQGAYGFFARLTSNQYAASNPFLLLFNHGVDYSQMVPAALAINAAAVDALAGDFNLDGTVDAADYTVWRNGLGVAYTQEDYNLWKSHFGQSAGGTGSGFGGSIAVPEPVSFTLAACSLLSMLAKIAVRPPRQPVQLNPGSMAQI